jgi:hypothetical protein
MLSAQATSRRGEITIGPISALVISLAFVTLVGFVYGFLSAPEPEVPSEALASAAVNKPEPLGRPAEKSAPPATDIATKAASMPARPVYTPQPPTLTNVPPPATPIAAQPPPVVPSRPEPQVAMAATARPTVEPTPAASDPASTDPNAEPVDPFADFKTGVRLPPWRQGGSGELASIGQVKLPKAEIASLELIPIRQNAKDKQKNNYTLEQVEGNTGKGFEWRAVLEHPGSAKLPEFIGLFSTEQGSLQFKWLDGAGLASSEALRDSALRARINDKSLIVCLRKSEVRDAVALNLDKDQTVIPVRTNIFAVENSSLRLELLNVEGCQELVSTEPADHMVRLGNQLRIILGGVGTEIRISLETRGNGVEVRVEPVMVDYTGAKIPFTKTRLARLARNPNFMGNFMSLKELADRLHNAALLHFKIVALSADGECEIFRAGSAPDPTSPRAF